MSIYTQLHSKYGSADKVVEFRLFNLNECSKSCENCFYQRAGNKVSQYAKALSLAEELESVGYELETCYLLPTDFFENPSNLEEVSKKEVLAVINKFKYVGIASTLESDMKLDSYLEYLRKLNNSEVELQINLVNERIFEEEYIQEVLHNRRVIKDALGDKVVFNLALNLGREISDDEYLRLKELVKLFSDDGIIEINFTYLYNEKVHQNVKKKRTIESLKSMNKLAKMYNKTESRFNNRTMMRKPAFIFKEDKVAIAPIIPFDEYLFIDEEEFYLNDITFAGFLETQNKLEGINQPIMSECHSCENLIHCMGKGYFICAHKFDLPCFLGVA